MKKKTLPIYIILLIGILVVTLTGTYAFLSYAKEGEKENTINVGKITFRYAENESRNIAVEGLPMTDESGKAQTDYFEFTITSDTSSDISIPYTITARKNDPNNVAGVIKVYLTKVNNDIETEVLLDDYDELSTETHNNHNEAVLHLDKVPINSTNYSQTYRLRMWIDNDRYFENLGNNNYDGKTFQATINVYSEGAAGIGPTY